MSPIRLAPAQPRTGPTGFSVFDPVLLLILLGVVIPAPASLRDAQWVDGLGPLPALAIGGLIVGYLTARSRLPGMAMHSLSLGLGVEATLIALAPLTAGASVGERAMAVAGRVNDWLGVAFGGGASSDPLIFAAAMAVLSWLLGYSSAWLLFRSETPWLAVTSNGLGLLMNLSYAPPNLAGGYLTTFLFASLLLLVAQTVARRSALWRRASLTVDPRLGLKLIGASAVLAGVLLTVAWAVPPRDTLPGAAVAWERALAPWRGMEQDFDRLFASVNRTERTNLGLNFGRTLAPRGAFELSDTPVLRIESSEREYWRAATADRYTGQAMTSSDVSGVDLEANQPLTDEAVVPGDRVEQTARVTVLASRTLVAFASDAPLKLDVPVHLEVRGDAHDIASIRLDEPLLKNAQYTVTSAVPEATTQQLRAAGEDYPDWVRQRFLQLPRRLPDRVRQQARELTRGLTNPFDKATAVEQYLRNNFTYSTRVPPVPPNRDWVDYFLFDSREGYCDFFATSMVVLLRTQGVPARVASGFAPGEQQADGTWLIRENHAHTWVEVYFPRYGWITFEPSAIRAIPDRPEAPVAPAPALPTPDTRVDLGSQPQLNPDELQELQGLTGTMSRAQLPDWVTAALATLGAIGLLLGLGATVVTLAWRRGIRTLPTHQRPYAQLVRAARWAGVVRGSRSDTPYEFANQLAAAVPEADATIRTLAEAYVEAAYANRPPTVDPWSTWLRDRWGVVSSLGRRRLRRLGDTIRRRR